MSLEALTPTTYISGLSSTWPTSSELKSQGDDHLRLIKGVLQNTFPNASVPFRFPTTTVAAAGQTLTIADQNRTVMLSTAGGDLAVTLPSLVAGDAGWTCEIMKTSGDANGIVVSPPSGTIASRVGTTASVRIGQLAEPAKLLWSGTTWFCIKLGMPIGTVISFDGTIPPGFLTTDGSAIPAVYIELIALLGSTLKDRRGRVDAGVDAASLRLSVSYFGATPTLGAVGGLESHLLLSAQSGVVAHQHAAHAKVTEANHTHPLNGGTGVVNYTGVSAGGGGTVAGTTISTSTDGAKTNLTVAVSSDGGTTGNNLTANVAAASAVNSHNNTQPTLIANRIIRAC